MNKAILILVCLAFSGCGMVGEAVLNSMKGKNPEIKRLELQKETTSEGIQAVKDPAVDEEKAKQIVRLVESSQRQGHPSFFSAIVSGIHTEEGRRLAGITTLALVSIGVAIWKGFIAYSKGQTILGLGRFIEKDVKPAVGKDVVSRGVGRELGSRDLYLRKVLKKRGIT